jgi:hypothetical protein
VKRQISRIGIVLTLLSATAFALWSWLRPYDWHPDSKARCEVMETLVTRDHSYYWLEIRLKMNRGEVHDLQQKVVLETSQGRNLEPADSTLRSGDLPQVSDLWFKFWLESNDLEGPLKLRINDGTLIIKSRSGKPSLDHTEHQTYTSNQW